RSALGDSAENPRFIETLPKRGYRFIADVSIIDADTRPKRPGSTTGDLPRPEHQSTEQKTESGPQVQDAGLTVAPVAPKRRWQTSRVLVACALVLIISLPILAV